MFKVLKKEKGFTLIELLVVISIISLLSSVVLVSVQDARQKARDAKFVQEINQLVIAIELYRTENGYYPGANLSAYALYRKNADGTPGTINVNNFVDLESLLVPKYIPEIPVPPGDGTESFYYYKHNKEPYISSNSPTRCKGETGVPEYLFIFRMLNYSDAFSNIDSYEVLKSSGWQEFSGYNCYSPL